jgi:hypothetical protein
MNVRKEACLPSLDAGEIFHYRLWRWRNIGALLNFCDCHDSTLFGRSTGHNGELEEWIRECPVLVLRFVSLTGVGNIHRSGKNQRYWYRILRSPMASLKDFEKAEGVGLQHLARVLSIRTKLHAAEP